MSTYHSVTYTLRIIVRQRSEKAPAKEPIWINQNMNLDEVFSMMLIVIVLSKSWLFLLLINYSDCTSALIFPQKRAYNLWE